MPFPPEKLFMNSLQSLWAALLFVVLVLTIIFVRQYYLQGWIEQIPIVRSLDDSYERAKKTFALVGKGAIQRFYDSKGSEHIILSEDQADTPPRRDQLVIRSTWHKEDLIRQFQQKGFSKGRLEAAIRVLDYVDAHKQFALQDMYEYKVLASVKLAQALLESEVGRSRIALDANNHFGIKGVPTTLGRKKLARIRSGHAESLCYCNRQTDFTYKSPAIGTINANDDHPTDAFEVYQNVGDSYHRHTQLLTACKQYGRKGCYGWIWRSFPVGGTADITQLAIDHRHITGMRPADYFGGQVVVPYYAAAAAGLKGAFYATSKTYPKKIKALIETYELWRFDYDLLSVLS